MYGGFIIPISLLPLFSEELEFGKSLNKKYLIMSFVIRISKILDLESVNHIQCEIQQVQRGILTILYLFVHPHSISTPLCCGLLDFGNPRSSAIIAVRVLADVSSVISQKQFDLTWGLKGKLC